jgi:hypothetical protein
MAGENFFTSVTLVNIPKGFRNLRHFGPYSINAIRRPPESVSDKYGVWGFEQ